MIAYCKFSDKEVDQEASAVLAEIIDARIGECVANVLRAFFEHRNSIPISSYYVEGFWDFGGQFYGHAWIETPKSLIDPTLIRSSGSFPLYSVVYYPVCAYFDNHLLDRFQNCDWSAGNRIDVPLDRNDPAVSAFIDTFDLPGSR